MGEGSARDCFEGKGSAGDPVACRETAFRERTRRERAWPEMALRETMRPKRL